MTKYYFLGIGGISMSALAIMLQKEGYQVSGSDETKSRATEMLEENGIEIDFSFNEKHIKDADIIVFSSAIKKDNMQYIYAKNQRKKMISRGELLGFVSDMYEKVIAVAGSHGKTTTTAMIYEILKYAGKNPTLHLGGFRVEDGKNFVIGDKEIFVTEACEYCDNFLNLYPCISVITNIEKEHLDYFKTFERQLKSFEIFKGQSQTVIENIKDLKAKNIRHDRNGGLVFALYKGKEKIINLHLKICEEINTQNCIYAYLVAKQMNIPDFIIKLGLENYQGVSTRFEKKVCKYCDCVVCDYAHHPTEISKAIKTAKKIYKNKHIVTIFQPHTYSRTKTLFEEFYKVFNDIEMPLFFKTYSARERPEDGMSSKEFAEILKKKNKNTEYFDTYDDLKEFLLGMDLNDKMLLFLGAGDLPAVLHKNEFLT